MWFKDGMTYPQGGSGFVAKLLADYIEKQGGHILLNANVDEILVEQGGGLFKKPTATGASALVSGATLPPVRVTYRAPAVVSDINLPATMRLSGMHNWPQQFQQRVAKFNYSDSLFSVSLGLTNRSVLAKIQGDAEILLADSLNMDANFARVREGQLAFMDLNEYSQVDPGCCGPRGSRVSLFSPRWSRVAPLSNSLMSPSRMIGT